jgi:hypothetical protein
LIYKNKNNFLLKGGIIRKQSTKDPKNNQKNKNQTRKNNIWQIRIENEIEKKIYKIVKNKN